VRLKLNNNLPEIGGNLALPDQLIKIADQKFTKTLDGDRS
jgi:hypothetical protein